MSVWTVVAGLLLLIPLGFFYMIAAAFLEDSGWSGWKLWVGAAGLLIVAFAVVNSLGGGGMDCGYYRGPEC